MRLVVLAPPPLPLSSCSAWRGVFTVECVHQGADHLIAQLLQALPSHQPEALHPGIDVGALISMTLSLMLDQFPPHAHGLGLWVRCQLALFILLKDLRESYIDLQRGPFSDLSRRPRGCRAIRAAIARVVSAGGTSWVPSTMPSV